MIKFALYDIDLEKDVPEFRSPPKAPHALEAYVAKLTKVIEEKSSKRIFAFTSSTVEVNNAISKFVSDNDFEDFCRIVANRLLAKEKLVQKEIARLRRRIKKGTLFLSLSNKDETTECIIAKVEAESFLDGGDFDLHTGLPFDNLAYRATLIRLEKNDVSEIFVYDTKSSLTRYWWERFLELQERHTDEFNTETAYGKVKTFLGLRIKKNDFPADHTFTLNSLNNYFATRTNFDIEELDSYLFNEYKPDAPDLNIPKIRSDLKKLPERKNFDSKFTINNTLIRNKFRIVIALTEKIDLTIKDAINDLTHVISAKEIEGQKCVVVRSDEGYNRIKREMEKEN